MKYFAYLYLLLLSLESAAQSSAKAITAPPALYGHWLKTDGSNRFIIGIYPNTVCYNNETWRINAAKQIQQRWQLQLESNNGKKTVVTVQRKDSTTLLLGNGAQQELKNICTFNFNYRPVQSSFPAQLFTAGNALLRGQLQRDKDDKSDYVQLSYTDIRTGKSEYLFADLDNLDRFSLCIPLHMPVICTLISGRQNLGTFLVQPGDTMLLAYNAATELNNYKQDYSKLMQRVCLMGSDAAFNNQYQYYKRYLTNEEDQKINPGIEQYDSELRSIDRTYPAYMTEQRFLDFVKAEARYNYVINLLKSSRAHDSAYLQKIYDQYLSQETPLALVHNSFYKMAGSFGFYICSSRSYLLSYYVNIGNIVELLQKEYKPILPSGFIEQYKVMQQYWNTRQKLSDSVIVQKYFNSNWDALYRFRYSYYKIFRELEMEKSDSLTYSLYERLISNTCMRFALNLQQLHGNSLVDDDIIMPSLYRIGIFEYYSRLPGFPYQQVVKIETANTMPFQSTAFDLKPDTYNIRTIDREPEWQKVLKTYLGKTVVVMAFPHYFDKEEVAQKIYKLKKMQERYRGKNIVFVKYIQQRNRSDWGRILLQYIDYFSEQDQLKDVLYCGYFASLEAMKWDVIEGSTIYNSSGQAHHPKYFSVPWEQRKKESFSIRGELDSVMTGKGRYNEERIEYYMGGADKKGKTWTLYDSTGNYFYYVFKEINEPIYDLRYDTVIRVLSVKDSLCQQSEQVLHRLSLPAGSHPANNKPQYSKSYTNFGPEWIYRYDRSTGLLKIYGDNKKLLRTYRIAFITDYYMELELIQ